MDSSCNYYKKYGAHRQQYSRERSSCINYVTKYRPFSKKAQILNLLESLKKKLKSKNGVYDTTILCVEYYFNTILSKSCCFLSVIILFKFWKSYCKNLFSKNFSDFEAIAENKIRNKGIFLRKVELVFLKRVLSLQ